MVAGKGKGKVASPRKARVVKKEEEGEAEAVVVGEEVGILSEESREQQRRDVEEAVRVAHGG